jgi:hypothetical protein
MIKEKYFNKNTERAIIKFNNSTDDVEKNKLWKNEIYPAFKTLIENLSTIHRINVVNENIDSVKNDCISHLFTIMNRFDPESGKAAFSYFDVVAKNYLIGRGMTSFKDAKKNEELFEDDKQNIKIFKSMKKNSDYDSELYTMSEDDEPIFDKEYLLGVKEFLVRTKNEIKKSDDFFDLAVNKHGRNLWKTINAIIYLLEHEEDIPTINKKSIRMYIKEISNLKNSQISSSLRILKGLYSDYTQELKDAKATRSEE